jgi:hypothetical protein
VAAAVTPSNVAEAVEVAVELGQALPERVGVAFAPHLHLDRLALPAPLAVRVRVGPANEDVDAATAGTVTLDAVPAKDGRGMSVGS